MDIDGWNKKKMDEDGDMDGIELNGYGCGCSSVGSISSHCLTIYGWTNNSSPNNKRSKTKNTSEVKLKSLKVAPLC